MSTSIFTDRTTEPTTAGLLEVLGVTGELWTDLRQHLEAEYGPLVEQWKHYGQKTGWLLKLLRKKRNLFFLTPLAGHFRMTFVFGDKAVVAIEESDVPMEIIEDLRQARKYAEGRGVSLFVRTSEDVTTVKKLVAIKLAN
ncbi:DUF3788 domain-containing protein [Candidatus Neomarinimicrobiota bacterium]